MSYSDSNFDAAYGSKLDDFYFISEDFQGRCLTETEDAENDCRVWEQCVYIKLATIASCEMGAVVKFDVLNSNEKVLSTEESEVFLIKTGEIIEVELGSEKLTQQGYIEPMDAYCVELGIRSCNADKNGDKMTSQFFKILAYIFYALAALLWVVLGLMSPAGVNQAGQPLDPVLYYEVGAFAYWILGSAFLIPVGIVAGIGAIFSKISSKLEK